MSRNPPEILYPAAAQTMRGIEVIEQLPDRNKPKPPGTQWPAYYEAFDTSYAHFDDGPTDKPRPSPYEISHCLTWVLRCKFLWLPGRDREDWKLFKAYALGVPIPIIRQKWFMHMSRELVESRLTQICYEIEVQSTFEAMAS